MTKANFYIPTALKLALDRIAAKSGMKKGETLTWLLRRLKVVRDEEKA